MRHSIIALLLTMLTANTVTAEAPAEPITQRGYLDGGQLLNGQHPDWRAIVDRLSGQGFTYIATSGKTPSGEVADYLSKNEIPVLTVSPVSAPTAGDAVLIVVEPGVQKTWAFARPELPVAARLLWSDDGTGAVTSWPGSVDGHETGVLLHAGSTRHGPVPDPYPGRIGETIAKAAQRGLAANVLVSAPDPELFSLNIEAAAAAMNHPQTFDGESFLSEWSTRQFGEAAAKQAATSLRLLHRAHEKSSPFVDLAEASLDIFAKLQTGKPEGAKLAPIKDARDVARLALERADEAAKAVADDRKARFEQQVTVPATLFVRKLELLESMARLGGAWKVYLALPTAPSAERVKGLIEDAAQRAVALSAALEGMPEGKDFRIPSAEDIRALGAKLAED